MRTIMYIILFLGIVGVIQGIINLFLIGVEISGAYHFDTLLETYKETVRRTADYLILVGGALLFLWLL